MTAAEWAVLVPAVAALATAVAAWIRAQAAHKKIDNLPTSQPPTPPTPPAS